MPQTVCPSHTVIAKIGGTPEIVSANQVFLTEKTNLAMIVYTVYGLNTVSKCFYIKAVIWRSPEFEIFPILESDRILQNKKGHAFIYF